MLTDEMPTKYCKRIKSQVHAEKSEDITGKVYVQCKHYTGEGRNPCNHEIGVKPFPNFKKCLVKLAVQREEKSKLSSQISSQ